MKIQIIKLDPNDDIVSARDKLSWGKTSRLLLVWPDHSKILTNRLDLTILNRYCKANGSQLGLVTNDLEIRENAHILGIPVFVSEEKALKMRWKRAKKSTYSRPQLILNFRSYKKELQSSLLLIPDGKLLKLRDNKWVNIFFFIAAILSVMALISIFIPSARIILSPETKIQEVSISVMASSQSKAVNISGVVPIKVLSVTVEGQGSLPTTGMISVADKTAGGQVVFSNLTENDLAIPVGTVVEGLNIPDIRFVTTTTKTIKGGIGKTVVVPIEATQPGVNGNLDLDSINAIEGSLGLELTVTNPYPTTGGSNKETASVSESDYQGLHDNLVQSLKNSAINQIKNGLGPGDVLIEESLGKMTLLNEVSDPSLNQPGDELTLSLRIEFTAQYISFADLSELSILNLDATLNPNDIPVPGSLSVVSIGKPGIDSDQVVHLQINATRTIQNKVDNDQVVNLVMGLTPSKAEEKLTSSLPLSNAPAIELNPTWWPNLPVIPFKISVMDGTHANNGY